MDGIDVFSISDFHVSGGTPHGPVGGLHNVQRRYVWNRLDNMECGGGGDTDAPVDCFYED